MRPTLSLNKAFRTAANYSLLALLLTVNASCSFPEIRLSKHNSGPIAGMGFVKGAGNAIPTSDKRYLTSVHIRFSESKEADPLVFDIRRDKKSMIAAKLWVGEKSLAVVDFGYTRNDGPVVGFHYNWRF